MQKLRQKVKKRLSVFLMLMLVLSVNLTAQSATQSQKEKTDSEDVFRQAQDGRSSDLTEFADANSQQELSLEEIMQIAEEEIERTAQEAVKAALLEVGGEVAFEKERADQMEKAKTALEIENKKLKEEVQKKNNQFFYGALIGGTGGVIVTSLVFGLIMGICK